MTDIKEFHHDLNTLMIKYKDQPVMMLIGALEATQFYLLHERLP